MYIQLAIIGFGMYSCMRGCIVPEHIRVCVCAQKFRKRDFLPYPSITSQDTSCTSGGTPIRPIMVYNNYSQEHGTETKSSANVKQVYLEQPVDCIKYCFVS